MIFDIGNASHKGCWIMATDEADALQVALDLGHIKNKKSARVHVMDEAVWMKEKGISELIQLGFRGQLMKRIQALTFAEMINEVQNGPRPDTSFWFGYDPLTKQEVLPFPDFPIKTPGGFPLQKPSNFKTF